MIEVKIKMETTNYIIIKSKQYILNKFFNIYNINYSSSYYLPVKKRKISLLRSPHIHKKTWKTYLSTTYGFKYTVILSSTDFSRLNILLKTLSVHSFFSFTFKELNNFELGGR